MQPVVGLDCLKDTGNAGADRRKNDKLHRLVA